MRLNLSVRQRLILAFGLMILLGVFVSGAGLIYARELHLMASETRDGAQLVERLFELEVEWLNVVKTVDHLLLTHQTGVIEDQLENDLQALNQSLRALQSETTGESSAITGQNAERLETLQVLGVELTEKTRELVTMARAGRWPRAQTTRHTDLAALERRFNENLYDLKNSIRRDVQASVSESTRVQRNIRWYWILAALGAILVGSWIGFMVITSITRPVAALVKAAEAVQEGDLSRRVEVARQDEIGLLARTLNKTSSQLQEMLSEMEQRVKERTHEMEETLFELEGAAQVAKQAASIRDIDQLLDETAHLMSVLLGFYHTGIFLLDEEGEYAVLQAASSQGGRRMLGRDHRLKVGGEGIIGEVAASGTARLALDVGEDAVHFVNPDLPDSHSEVAVPMEVRGKIIGVIDVQSKEKEAFSDQDVAIIKTLADQIALAVENARLLEESERAVRELERLYGQQVREAWQRSSIAQSPTYRYTQMGVEKEGEPADLMEVADEPKIVQERDGRQLAAPIRLRGQNIGSILLRQDQDEEPWSPDEVALMEEISDQIALALENARLLEETQRRAARERLVGEITTRMRESLDVEAVLQTAAREMRTALDLEEAEVRIMPSALEDDET
jgi:GAF domain-containing protein/HAMP domain-containing protein